MTEADWLSCTDPREMLAFLRGRASERKLRLFACAAWRWRYTQSAPWVLRQTLFRGMARLLARVERDTDEAGRPPAGPWWGALTFGMPDAWQVASATVGTFEDGFLGLFAPDTDRAVLVTLLRDVFGRPNRRAGMHPAWRTTDIVGLAEAAYAERSLPSGHLDPARLAILADAVLDAGCGDAELLAHLRGPGPHVRGCWAVDLLTGRE